MGVKIETKISVILPTYNGAKSIASSVESVIAQSFQDWELIIIDDGSIDNTLDIINQYTRKDPRIISSKNENNLGIQKTLNTGLKKAEGEYIARIDDDDKWIDRDKLKKQFEFLENNKDYVLMGTKALFYNEKRNRLIKFLPPESDIAIRNELLGKNLFAHSSVMFRKKSVMALGGYSEEESKKHIEDYDLWLRLGLVGKLHNLPDFAVECALGSDSISFKNRVEQFRKTVKLSQKYKDRYPKPGISLSILYLRLYFLFFLALFKK